MITEAGESNSNEYSVLQQKFANDSGVFPGEGCLFLFVFCSLFFCFSLGGGGVYCCYFHIPVDRLL